jgi:hypothetical protein
MLTAAYTILYSQEVGHVFAFLSACFCIFDLGLFIYHLLVPTVTKPNRLPTTRADSTTTAPLKRSRDIGRCVQAFICLIIHWIDSRTFHTLHDIYNKLEQSGITMILTSLFVLIRILPIAPGTFVLHELERERIRRGHTPRSHFLYSMAFNVVHLGGFSTVWIAMFVMLFIASVIYWTASELIWICKTVLGGK